MKTLLPCLVFASIGLAQFAPPAITTTSLPNGAVNVTYGPASFTCTNCSGFTWSVSSGFPPGLSVNAATGNITGVPTTAGTYNFTVILNTFNAPLTKALSITINPPPLTLLNTSFPSGKVQVAYPTQKLVASGGTPPYSYSITNGSLPPGLSISGVTLGGTPTTPGTYPFTLAVFDSLQNSSSANFSITIFGVVSINNTSFPSGTVNAAYPTQTLVASGGVAPYQWSVSQGTLPPGLGLTTSSGGTSITGTPTTTGAYSFILFVSDYQQNTASATFSITIAAAGGSPAITTTTLPNGVLNQPYSATLNCVNCSGYAWSITSGGLPSGLSLSAGGAISGTPNVTGTYPFQVALTPPASFASLPPVTQNFSITVVSASLSITQSTLPVAFQNTPYSTTLTGAGGSPPYTWSFLSTGNDGLTIGANTGTISGTPTAAGQFSVNVQIADSSGATAMKGFALNVAASLNILTASLPNGSVGIVYPTQTLSAGGGQPPYRWSIPTTSGALPPGLTLDGVFGRISGTPTSAGTYSFNLVVTDNQSNTANANLSITVGGGITISPATLPNGAVGAAYSQTLTATGGAAPYVWSVASGSLPAGLTLNAGTGVIGGTPTAAGTATFTAQATDSTQAFGQAKYTVIVTTGPLTITTTSLPDGVAGSAYSQTLAATGGTPPYAWAVTAGSLPAGLTLNASTGAIAGTPSAAAASSFTVTVTDSVKATAQQALAITTVALTVSPTSLPAAVVGVAYSQQFTASGGKAPYTYAIGGTLPAGFVFTASTATISGTAPAVETGSFPLTVADAAGHTLSVSLTLTASAAPLTVTPTSLPAAVVGVAYAQKLTASGGVSPYTFALTSGSLPAGFAFTAGTISGTAAAAGSTNFTIRVTDSASAKLDVPLTLVANNPAAPTVTVTGIPATSGFSQQLPVGVSLSGTYPVDIDGTIALTFAPSVNPPAGVDDAMIQFSSGGRSINFTIPAGSLKPTLTNASSITILTGTTAGTITVTTTLTTNGAVLSSKTNTIVNNPGVPFISSVSFQQTPGGVTVTVVGFSSTRDMVSGLFHFAPASNMSFTQSDITVPLASAFSTWWSNTAQSNPYGTQFTLTVPFTLSTQSTSVVSVTVTLTNSKGDSKPVSPAQ